VMTDVVPQRETLLVSLSVQCTLRVAVNLKKIFKSEQNFLDNGSKKSERQTQWKQKVAHN
jgi:hypothetical protein